MCAQDGVYARAFDELRQGRKTSHWMWFVFPQIAGLGHSAMARHYAIADVTEAGAYLAHPVLGPRLIDCAHAAMAWAGKRSAIDILGQVDAAKLRSSATLFQAAGGAAVFGDLLDAYYDGVRDPATVALLG